MIWTYAVGNHHIHIQDAYYGKRLHMTSGYRALPLYSSALDPLLCGFVRPTFQLPQVCRQIYCESSPLMYTKNRFSFDSLRATDGWIKSRPLGQKRLVTSINVPFQYMNLYYGGFRKPFNEKFPNIKQIGVPLMFLYLSRELDEKEQDTQNRIVFNIKEYEGQGVNVVYQSRIQM